MGWVIETKALQDSKLINDLGDGHIQLVGVAPYPGTDCPWSHHLPWKDSWEFKDVRFDPSSKCRVGCRIECSRLLKHLEEFARILFSVPWRRKWQPTRVLLPGKSHGQRSLVGYSLWDRRVGHDWATSLSLSLSSLLSPSGEIPCSQVMLTRAEGLEDSSDGIPQHCKADILNPTINTMLGTLLMTSQCEITWFCKHFWQTRQSFPEIETSINSFRKWGDWTAYLLPQSTNHIILTVFYT